MDKPWLLIDVDGPLNPFDAAWFPKGPAPDGWRIHHLMPQEYPDGLPVALNPLLGLPTDLPVVPLTRDRHSFVRRSWKTDQIAAWAGPARSPGSTTSSTEPPGTGYGTTRPGRRSHCGWRPAPG